MDLLQNPFHILTANLHDNRRRIMELADERGLSMDSNECVEARSILTNPRRRVSAEAAWLPGIGSKRVEEMLSLLESSPEKLLAVDNLPPISRANLLTSALARLSELKPDDVAKWIIEIAHAFEDTNPEKLRIMINEERVAAGFPELSDISVVETEIQERRRHYGKVIKFALDNLPSKELVRTVTNVVELVTDVGKKRDPILISDLVNSFEVEAQEFLEKEEENIKALVKRLRTAVEAKKDDSELDVIVNRLIEVVKNWDTVAQPIQVSTMSRGLRHETSYRVSGIVRELAIEIFNKHGKREITQKLTNMLREVFAEVVEVAERVGDDAKTLREIKAKQSEFEAQFRKFNLNENSFSYEGKTYNTNDIHHIGFYRAITTHRTNFTETGKTEQVKISLTMSAGYEVNISVDEQGIFLQRNKSEQINTVVKFYSYLCQTTFNRRVKFYESQIETHGYFAYDKCRFYPHDKIVHWQKVFELSSTSFSRDYGYVEMTEKNSIALRFVSTSGIPLPPTNPHFSTIVDTDVIFYLLDKHFSLKWNS